jgi:hypothetical protein
MYVHGLLERLGIADAVRKLKSVRTRRAIGQISYRTHGDACIQGPQHGTGFLTRPMLQRP